MKNCVINALKFITFDFFNEYFLNLVTLKSVLETLFNKIISSTRTKLECGSRHITDYLYYTLYNLIIIIACLFKIPKFQKNVYINTTLVAYRFKATQLIIKTVNRLNGLV